MPGLVAPLVVRSRQRLAHWPSFAVAAFGLLMLYGVGFSTLSVAHNAAHDTRHATGFPCH